MSFLCYYNIKPIEVNVIRRSLAHPLFRWQHQHLVLKESLAEVATNAATDTGSSSGHTAPDCASPGGRFYKWSLFVTRTYLRGYQVISGATEIFNFSQGCLAPEIKSSP